MKERWGGRIGGKGARSGNQPPSVVPVSVQPYNSTPVFGDKPSSRAPVVGITPRRVLLSARQSGNALAPLKKSATINEGKSNHDIENKEQ